MPLIIPDESHTAIVDLVLLPSEQREALLASLRRASPSTSLWRFASSIPSPDGLDNVIEVVETLAALYGLIEESGDSPRELANDLVEAAAELKLGEVEYTPELTSELVRFFEEVFSLDDSLGLTSKAGEVAIENERNYAFARIITDLRPIYLNKDAPTPHGAVVVHILKIAIHETEQEYYFALDGEDLRDLKEVLDRAVQKEEALSSLVIKHGELRWLER